MPLGADVGNSSAKYFLDDLTINLPGVSSSKSTTTQTVEKGGQGTQQNAPPPQPFPWFALVMVILGLVVVFLIVYFKLWQYLL